MDFKNANELLALCEEKNLPISEIMRIREIELGETASEIVNKKMTRVLGIMKDAAFSPIRQPVKSMGGLIGGEARKLSLHAQEKKGLCGNLLQKAITYAMATLETNASMGLIVASPTAGSAGIVPGLMLAMQEHYQFSDEEIIRALFNASAIGYLAMRNATVAGAVGGCQAEVGVASAMAASAAVELMGGSPKECTFAASTVLMNMLGLVCYPVAGLIEYTCQNWLSQESRRRFLWTKRFRRCLPWVKSFLQNCVKLLWEDALLRHLHVKHAIYAVNRLTNKKTVSVMHLFSTYNVHIQDSFLLFFQLCQHF